MLGFLARRAIQLVFVLLAISTALFVLLRISGDPVAILAGENASPEVVARVRNAMGLDRPLYVQYARFVGDALTLRFGDSITARRDAMGLVLDRLPATLLLTAASFLIVVVVGLPLGVYAGVRRRSPGASAALLAAYLGQSMPTFWLGILMILVFAVQLRWLPSAGAGEARHLVLPALTLAAVLLPKTVRLVRSGMLEVLGQDYVRTARSKGLAPMTVVARHALKNALIPVITVLGMDVAQLMGGAVIVETIFSWPGLGRLLTQSVYGRDYPVVQATVFVITILVVLINLLVDLLYAFLDPRIKVARS